MSQRDTLLRYSAIVNLLKRRPATYSEIEEEICNRLHERDAGTMISRRTFYRDRLGIESLFDIEISFDKSEGVYYIAGETKPEMSMKLLETFDMLNLISVSKKMMQYIHFESHEPSGTGMLQSIIRAIEERKVVDFSHKKFSNEAITLRHAEPYALKEFKNRWYMLAKDLSDNLIKSFALDRMSALCLTPDGFSYPRNFDVREHFKHCYGIIGPGTTLAQQVVLSFAPLQGKYIKSLPLHASQTILVDNEQECRVQLKVCVTVDFIMELQSYGAWVTVLEPATLRNQMKDNALKVSRNHQ